jgi:hypothetical protein
MGQRALVGIFFGAYIGAAALMILLSAPAGAQTTGKVREPHARVDIPSDIVVTELHIALLKYALNLRPTQEQFWAPVEAALRELARLQATSASDIDATERAYDRPAGGNVVATRIRRIAALAVPLIKALDENQRRAMMGLARMAGLEQLLASQK